MTRKTSILSLTLATLLIVGVAPHAGAGEIVLEGTLQDAAGQPLADGVHLFSFDLFTNRTGGLPVWHESHDDVRVTAGEYAVTLGSKVPLELPPGFYWAEITIDGEVLAPRTKVTVADGDCTITGNLIVDGGIVLGAASPLVDVEIVGDGTPGGAATFRSSYSTGNRNWFGEMKFTGADGLVLNSQTGGTFSEIRLQNNGTTNMYLAYDGKLGVGTDTPGARLEVAGDARFGDWSTAPSIQDGVVQVHNLSGTGDTFLVTNYSFGTEAALVVTGSSEVGINNASPTHMLDVGSSGAYCDGGAWVNGSSREYKDNIAELDADDAIETLAALRPSSFTYKTNPDELNLGFVAEDVPDLVATNDRKGLVTMDIVAVLTKVVQTQQAKLEALERELAELRSARDD